MSLTNYNITGKLGEGDSGIVYRAIDRKNRQVAIKKMYLDQDALDELSVHSKLNHLPFIPQLYQHFIAIDNDIRGPRYPSMKMVDGDPLYLVMKLIDGQSVHQLIITNGWEYTWMMIYQILVVIRDLHRSGFYHGDLHLGNLILSSERMYLIDFGSAGSTDGMRDECDRRTDIRELARNWFHLRLLEQLNDEERIIKNIRDDYSVIFDLEELVKTDNKDGDKTDYKDSDQWDPYLERYQLLLDIMDDSPCEGVDDNGNYVTDNDYIELVLNEYRRLDQLEL